MSVVSLRHRTIVLMDLRCSFRLLLPSSSLPLSPRHNCCIASDVISCFLLGVSAVGPHLCVVTASLFAVESASALSRLFIFVPCVSSTQLFCAHTFSLYVTHLLLCWAMFLSCSHLSFSVFAVLIVLLFSSLSCPCSEG